MCCTLLCVLCVVWLGYLIEACTPMLTFIGLLNTGITKICQSTGGTFLLHWSKYELGYLNKHYSDKLKSVL
jgi:hypothetical protein